MANIQVEATIKVPDNLGGIIPSVPAETADMIITVSAASYDKMVSDKFNITHGCVADVLAVIKEDRHPVVKIRFISGDDYDRCIEEYNVQVQAYGETLFASCVASKPYYTYGMCVHSFMVSSDGKMTSTSMKSVALR